MLFLGGEADKQNFEVPNSFNRCEIPIPAQNECGEKVFTVLTPRQLYVKKTICYLGEYYPVMIHRSDEEALISFLEIQSTLKANATTH